MSRYVVTFLPTEDDVLSSPVYVTAADPDDAFRVVAGIVHGDILSTEADGPPF